MLAIAREKAVQKGLTNYNTQACDVSLLPFADNTFDAISCRFGYMFFPDMLIATKEMVRVLKPGGKMVTTVWGSADENTWLTAMTDAINKNIVMPAPVPGAPGMFRCAAPGFMVNLFAQAGLSNIKEEKMIGKVNFGSNEKYWENRVEVSVPIAEAMAKAGDELQNKIRNELFDFLEVNYPGAHLPYTALLVSGSK